MNIPYSGLFAARGLCITCFVCSRSDWAAQIQSRWVREVPRATVGKVFKAEGSHSFRYLVQLAMYMFGKSHPCHAGDIFCAPFISRVWYPNQWRWVCPGLDNRPLIFARY